MTCHFQFYSQLFPENGQILLDIHFKILRFFLCQRLWVKKITSQIFIHPHMCWTEKKLKLSVPTIKIEDWKLSRKHFKKSIDTSFLIFLHKHGILIAQWEMGCDLGTSYRSRRFSKATKKEMRKILTFEQPINNHITQTQSVFITASKCWG